MMFGFCFLNYTLEYRNILQLILVIESSDLLLVYPIFLVLIKIRISIVIYRANHE